MKNRLHIIKPVIYFDNTIFNLQNIGGISIVFSELINKLKKNTTVVINMVVNVRTDGYVKNFTYNGLTDGVNAIREIGLPKVLQRFLPLLKKLPKGVVYHSTYNRYSFQKDIFKVITVHDLGHEKKIMQHGIKRFVHVFFKRIAIANADGIICVSESTKNDLLLFYGKSVKNKFIKVIYNGLSEEFLNYNVESNKQNVSNKILFVGSRYAYKNFDKSVIAISKTDFDLIVAGGGELTPADKTLLENYLPGRYFIEVNISTARLINLYSSSFCLLYLSSYEGFGLPILEAMASGCPVISCDNSCIREVSGTAALVIKDAEAQCIINAINLLKEKRVRAEMITAGKLHSRKFSWDNTVKNMIEFYNELILEKV